MPGASRIAASVLPLVLLAACSVAGADPADPAAADSIRPAGPPSSFDLRRIPRAEFPLARPLVGARRGSETASSSSLLAPADPGQKPWEQSLPWDQANGEFSGEGNNPRGGTATSRGRFRLDLLDYLPGEARAAGRTDEP